MSRKNSKALFLIIGLFILNLLAWSFVFDLNNNLLKVTFFDVGQGDSIFIETPGRNQILIDGGPTDKILNKLGKEMGFWDRTIDLVILTHPEHDHMAGLISVMQRYRVENVLWTGALKDSSEYEKWIDSLSKENANIFIAHSGQRISAGSIKMFVLNPTENLQGIKPSVMNDSSVVTRLVYGNNSFVFTGDASKAVEQKIVASQVNIDSDVLKVGHHGSKTSTASSFLAALTPQLAIISVGADNPYGHPNSEVLDILNNYDINVLRTDRFGDIQIISDGLNLKIN